MLNFDVFFAGKAQIHTFRFESFADIDESFALSFYFQNPQKRYFPLLLMDKNETEAPPSRGRLREV